MRIPFIISILSIFSLCISCANIPARYVSETRLARDRGLAGKKNIAVLSIKQESDNRTTAALTSPLFPAVTILGDIREDGQGFIYSITKVRLFAVWPNGWTEGICQGSGKLFFTGTDEGMRCRIEDTFMLGEIISGEIRYNDVFYRREDGRFKVKNRVDRLCEISRFLRERGLSPVYGHVKEKTMYGPGFRAEIIPFLFPERENFSRLEKKGLLPAEYYIAKEKFPAQAIWGADLLWRMDYTRAVFPEHLWQLRDSGTMWRDFEEAPLLFFSLYNIQYFFDTIIKEESFIKVK
jgi:hypothetical protein